MYSRDDSYVLGVDSKTMDEIGIPEAKLPNLDRACQGQFLGLNDADCRHRDSLASGKWWYVCISTISVCFTGVQFQGIKRRSSKEAVMERETRLAKPKKLEFQKKNLRCNHMAGIKRANAKVQY
jgi:hypothetical protein